MSETTVVINNFNRCYPLRKLLNWLSSEALGVGRIFVIDNNSDYEPTFALYEEFKDRIQLHQLRKNVGHTALRNFCSSQFKDNERFIITDPDMFPIDNCPNDLVLVLNEFLDWYPDVEKAGVGLSIDLPDHYPLKQKVVHWEKRIRRGKTPCGKGIFCPIDTTFCLVKNKRIWNAAGKHIRTIDPYLFVHWDWTVDPDNSPDEYLHYLKTANNSASYKRALDRFNRFMKKNKRVASSEEKRRFWDSVIDKQYIVTNQANNSDSYLSFVSESVCRLWESEHPYEPVSDSSMMVYRVTGTCEYDFISFGEDFSKIHGNTTEGHNLNGKTFVTCTPETEERVMSVLQGKSYWMRNIDHNSETSIKFCRDGKCRAWDIEDNEYRVLGDRTVSVKYVRGNLALDTVEFNEDFSRFAGTSNLGWRIEGAEEKSYIDLYASECQSEHNNDAIMFAAYVPSSNEMRVIKELFDAYEVSHVGCDMYLGINPPVHQDFIDFLNAYNGPLNITHGFTRDGLVVDSDASAFQEAVRLYRKSDKQYELLWFGHTKGATNVRSHSIRRRFITNFILQRNRISQLFKENERAGSHSMYLVRDGRVDRHKDVLSKFYEFEKDDFLSYWHPYTFYVVRDFLVRNFVRDCSEDFFDKNLITDMHCDRYFFERDFVKLAWRQGYYPLFDRWATFNNGQTKNTYKQDVESFFGVSP